MATIITLTLTVSDIAQVMTVYDRIRVFRSTTGATGEYTLLTPNGQDIPLVAGVSSYTYEDDQGDPAAFYRSVYYSTTKDAESVPSQPFGSGIEPALSVLSVQDLKDRFLVGIDLTDSKGNPFPDAYFINTIRSAVRNVEAMLDLTLLPTPIKNERKDYYQAEANQFFFVQLNKRPVMTVEAFRLAIPGGTPIHFPSNWVEANTTTGVVEVVPQSAVALTPSVGFSPYFTQYFLSVTRRRIPNALEIDYTAGFPIGQVPGDILEVVGKQASMEPLRTAGNLLLGAGVAGQSIGIDGLSQSVSLTKQGNGAFAAMVQDYKQDIMQNVATIKSRYHGINVSIV